MAISKQFSGSTIRKPGAYSVSQVALSAGAASSTTGVLLLVGGDRGSALWSL